jgi:hypothetical protein
MIAYAFEKAYDLAISPVLNVSRNPGFSGYPPGGPLLENFRNTYDTSQYIRPRTGPSVQVHAAAKCLAVPSHYAELKAQGLARSQTRNQLTDYTYTVIRLLSHLDLCRQYYRTDELSSSSRLEEMGDDRLYGYHHTVTVSSGFVLSVLLTN